MENPRKCFHGMAVTTEMPNPNLESHIYQIVGRQSMTKNPNPKPHKNQIVGGPSGTKPAR